MTHIEEHILERFVVDPDSLASSAAAIEQHLSECHGCRETVARIRTFYTALERRLDETAAVPEPAEGALVAMDRRLSEVPAQSMERTEYTLSYWRALRSITRRHPVIVASVTTTIVSLLSFILLTIPSNDAGMQPDYHHTDVERSIVEIRNKKHETLWKLAVENIKTVTGRGIDDYLILEDIDGDGTKEVMISAALSDRTAVDQQNLYVFNGDGTERFRYIPESNFTFRGRTYSESFGPRSIAVSQDRHGKKRIVLVTTNGRSPTIVSVLEADGTLKGQFRHFGNISSMIPGTIADGTPVVLLNGTCDLLEFEDNSDRNYPVTIVLDPEKLQGISESSHTRGGSYPATPAELYYLRFPLTDIDTSFFMVRTGARSGNIASTGFIIKSAASNDSMSWDFDYSLDRSMRVTDVKPSDGTYHIHKQLVRSGKLRTTIDSLYLERLKNGVQYWDGKEWQHSPVRVGFF